MRTGQRLGGTLVLLGAAAMLSCGGDGPSLSPSSLTSLATPRSSLSIRPSDYHDPAPMPDPAPTPDPAPDPAPDPSPAPAPDPTAVTIRIVGNFGRSAFTPNPIQASVGNMIVWTNADRELHDIVLDDGTPIGTIAPGRSSVPRALTTATTAYHCTIHSSMVGTINDPSVPALPPVYEPPPPYEDPYYDGYSHRSRVTATVSH